MASLTEVVAHHTYLEELANGIEAVSADVLEELPSGREAVSADVLEELPSGREAVSAYVLEELPSGREAVSADVLEEQASVREESSCHTSWRSWLFELLILQFDFNIYYADFLVGSELPTYGSGISPITGSPGPPLGGTLNLLAIVLVK